MSSSRPTYDHVVLISLDTLRSDCISANPVKLWPGKHDLSQTPSTPGLDRLIADGSFFPNTISAAPYTSASHATFFTGKWPLHHGVYEFFNRRLQSATLFTRARQRGYRTVFKVDFPVILGSFLGFDAGIDDYIVEDDEAALDRISGPDPTVSFVHFGGLHIPYGFHNLHYGGDAYREKVHALEREVDFAPSDLPDQLVETYHSAADLELLHRYKTAVQQFYAGGQYDRLLDLYIEGVNFFFRNRFDCFMDRLLDRLDGSRYLIVLFSDHGEEYDEDSYGHFNTLAEPVLRVPVLFYGHDVKPGWHDTRFRSVDVAPTVLDMAGFPAAAKRAMDGVSHVDTVTRGSAFSANTAVAQAYTSDAGEFVKFQRRLLSQGRKTGRLQHVRYKESAYDQDFKLRRQNYVYESLGRGLQPCPPRVRLERIGADGQPRPFQHVDIEHRLQGVLDAYNKTRKRGTQIPEMPEDVRRHLWNLGYHV